jgi:hypothetical protein
MIGLPFGQYSLHEPHGIDEGSISLQLNDSKMNERDAPPDETR